MQPGAQAAVQERPSVSFQDDGDADGGNVADHGGGGDDGAGTIFFAKLSLLRTQCKAVPRRVPRQDCQQVPTLQVRKSPFLNLVHKLMETLNFVPFS